MTPARSSPASALDAVGYETGIIERRLDKHQRVGESDVHVALLGLDNLPARRLPSNVGWRLAVDVGLGSGNTDLASILLPRFPGSVASSGHARMGIGVRGAADGP